MDCFPKGHDPPFTSIIKYPKAKFEWCKALFWTYSHQTGQGPKQTLVTYIDSITKYTLHVAMNDYKTVNYQDNNGEMHKLQCWKNINCIFPTYIPVILNTTPARVSFLQPPHSTREKAKIIFTRKNMEYMPKRNDPNFKINYRILRKN